MRPNQIMKGMKKNVRGLRLLPLYLFTLLLLTIACSSIDCPVQNVVATIYKMEKADGTADTLHDKLSILTRRSNGILDTLVNNSTNTTLLQLPVGYTNPEDTLLFEVTDASGIYSDSVYIKK